MALADDNFEELKTRVFHAYKNEEPIIQKFRDYAEQLKSNVRPIREYSVNAVSFVSSDGGDNRLYFNQATIELVRVVDSRGNQCALDAIASNKILGQLMSDAQYGFPKKKSSILIAEISWTKHERSRTLVVFPQKVYTEIWYSKQPKKKR